MRRDCLSPLSMAKDYVPIIVKAKTRGFATGKTELLRKSAKALGLHAMYFYHPNTRKRNRYMMFLGSGNPVKGYESFNKWRLKVEKDFIKMAKELHKYRDSANFSRWLHKHISFVSQCVHKVEKNGIKDFTHMMNSHKTLKQYMQYKREMK